MFSVSEANFFALKKGFLSHSGNKIAASIYDTGEPNNGVFLPLFLYIITCGACLFSDVGMCISLATLLLEGVCGNA